MIPGITVDYGATPLNCENSHLLGIESFVGGASDGKIGIAVMRYTNPVTKSLHWQKTWFFLNDDVQHVMIAALSSKSGASVRSVLDQRRASGRILIDGSEVRSTSRSGCRTLWHGNVGYKFDDPDVSLKVQREQKNGDWSKIGTSTQPPVTVDMFTAFIEHGPLESSVSYSVFPGADADAFNKKSDNLRLQSVQNDAHASAIYDGSHDTLMAAFWDASGGSVTFTPDHSNAPITISVDGNAAVIYKLKAGEVTLSDPSQTLSTIRVTLSSGRRNARTLTFTLPQGGLAGSSVTQST